jgi:hypothetical protein
VRAALRAVAVLNERCAEALSAARPRSVERIRGPRAGGIVLDDAVADVRAATLDALARWARVVAASSRESPPGRQVSWLAVYVAAHLDAVGPALARLEADLVDLAGRARAVLALDGRALTELGRCVENGCDARVFAATGAGPRAVRCSSGHVWAPQQWLALAKRWGRTA